MKIIVVLLLVLISFNVFSSGDLKVIPNAAKSKVEPSKILHLETTKKSSFDHAQTEWNEILKANVKANQYSSTVNYKNLKSNSAALNKYLHSLELVTMGEYQQFTENEKLAFLINAYNALTVKLVIDHYPVKSIKKIGSLFTNSWKIKFFKLFQEDHDLDYIEHKTIRKQFNEPRIHFALVCASIGCPALLREAYVPEQLEKQLASATQNFLADTSRNRYIPDKNLLEVSSIFKWYGEDFIKKYGSLENFLADNMALDSAQQKKIKAKQVTIRFLDYNWSLNE